MSIDVVDKFVDVFRGRGDVYGSWSGGCVKERLTRDVFARHLHNGPHIGVYPLVNDMVSWGCVDIDGKDFGHDWDQMFDLAGQLQAVLAVKQIHLIHERTRNGIHLWVFPDVPLIPAAHMRRALMAGCKVIGYDPKEVNPKQEASKQGVGNYVRLPYYGALLHGTPPDRYFIADAEQLDLHEAIDYAEENRTDATALEQVAAMWTPPARSKFTGLDVDESVIRHLVPLMNGYDYVIYRDGPMEDSDRSNTLYRLAARLRSSGFSADDTYLLIRAADQRWGKFHARKDGDQRLADIIERVYA